MADAFISYSRRDRRAAELVSARLEREGCTTWWDKSVTAGEDWSASIRRELEAGSPRMNH
jgi:hypothetical protein